jgi:hypothetical protein
MTNELGVGRARMARWETKPEDEREDREEMVRMAGRSGDAVLSNSAGEGWEAERRTSG